MNTRSPSATKIYVTTSVVACYNSITNVKLNSIKQYYAIYRQAVVGLDSDVVRQHCQEFRRQVAARQHPRCADRDQRHLTHTPGMDKSHKMKFKQLLHFTLKC